VSRSKRWAILSESRGGYKRQYEAAPRTPAISNDSGSQRIPQTAPVHLDLGHAPCAAPAQSPPCPPRPKPHQRSPMPKGECRPPPTATPARWRCTRPHRPHTPGRCAAGCKVSSHTNKASDAAAGNSTHTGGALLQPEPRQVAPHDLSDRGEHIEAGGEQQMVHGRLGVCSHFRSCSRIFHERKRPFLSPKSTHLPPCSGVQRLSSKALVITLTELSAMAAPATTGLR